MLFAVDGDGAPLGQAGADAVGARLCLGPGGAGPQARGREIRIVAGMAAAVHGDAAGIGQHDAGAKPADHLKEPVQVWRGGGQQRPSLSCASASSCAVMRLSIRRAAGSSR